MMLPARWALRLKRLLRLALLLGLSQAQVAQACECQALPLDSQETLAEVDLIFEGRPVYSRLHFKGMGQVKIRTRWAVLRVLRGPVLSTVEIDSPAGGTASCGFELRLGEQQLLAARGSPQKGFTTDLCTHGLGSLAFNSAAKATATAAATAATTSGSLRRPP